MKFYRHYIWDFDGTLFDSYPHAAAALCATMARFGRAADPERVRRWMQISFATAFDNLGVTDEELAFFKTLHGDPDFPPPVKPFPQAEPTLRALAARGAKHCLYTHSRARVSVGYLAKFGMDGLFADFMTPDDPAFTRKPDPGALRALLERQGIPTGEAAMVGDREIDMRSARAAGIDGILVDPERLVGDTVARFRTDSLAALLEE